MSTGNYFSAMVFSFYLSTYLEIIKVRVNILGFNAKEILLKYIALYLESSGFMYPHAQVYII